MKKLVMRLLAAALVVLAIGFYRGWFTLSRPAADAGSGKVNVTLSTDTGKMKDDAEAVKEKARSLTSGGTSDGVAGERPGVVVTPTNP